MATDITLGEHLLVSPEDDTEQAFLDFLNSAQKSIYVMVFGWHLPAMTDLLIAKHKAGLDVRLILDHSQATGKAEHDEIQKLIDAGVPFIIGTSPSHGAIMHLKVTIVDGMRVEHGSWNYSTSAHYQANEMWFTESDKLAARFMETFAFLERFIIVHETRFQPAGEVWAHDEIIGANPYDAEAHIAAVALAGRAVIHQPQLAHRAALASPARAAALAASGVAI